MHISGHPLHGVTLFYVAASVQTFCQCQHHSSFPPNYVIVLHIPKWPMLKNVYWVLVSFKVVNVIFDEIIQGIVGKMQE